MLKALILIIFYVFTVSISIPLFAQNPSRNLDSLRTILDYVSDLNSKVEVLNNLAIGYLNQSGDSGLYYAQEAMNISVSNNLKAGIAKSSETMARLYLAKQDYFKALNNYNKAQELYDELSLESEYWNTKREIGVVHFDMDDYLQALEYFLEVLKHYETIGDFEGVATVSNHIGVLFYREGSLDKALEYYHRVNDILEKNKSIDSDIYARLLTNLGLSYYAINDYEKAEVHFFKSIKANQEIGNPHIDAVNTGNLALVYFELQKHDKAEIFFKEAIQKSEKTGNRLSIAVNKGNLGQLYLAMAREELRPSQRNKLLNEAVANLQIALQTLEELKDLRRYQGYTEVLSVAYELKGEPKKALQIYKRHILFKDSVFNIENSKALASKEISYYVSKRMDSIRLVNEKEIAVRDATLQSNKKQRWFFVSGIFFLSIIGTLLFYQNRMRRRSNITLKLLNEELNEANQVKARFFSILNHDLRAPISNVIKFLRIQQNNDVVVDETTKQRLANKTVKTAENLLESMDDMLLWSKGQMENFKPQFKVIKVKLLFRDFNLLFENLSLVEINYEDKINLELITDENYLKTIMRNLTSNAIKILEHTPDAQIIWKAYIDNGVKVLSITDNGPGIGNDKFQALYDENYAVSNKTGLGMHLVRDMAKAIKVSVIVRSEVDKGTNIKLKFA